MSLFAELKRRNVVRVGVAYAVIGWVIAQIAEFAFENFGAPDWVLKSVVVILLLGLPIVLFFAWAFELTPEGVKREKDVDRSQSITPQTGQKLDRTIIVVLVIALAWFAWDKFGSDDLDVTSAPPAAVADVDESPTEIVKTDLSDKSVAVLPFVAMSSGPDDEYFADGLTEEILNSLAQLPELLVTARTSAFSFKGQDIPIPEIAAALGVQHVVEGSVRRSGDRLRVTAQLIRANDGFHLWSENYDSSSTDTISVQENIAEQIAAALDVILDERKRAAMKQAGLRDAEAFTLYQKAMKFYADAHGEIDTIVGLRQANIYLDQVIARVPSFSQAYMDHSDLFVHVLNDAASSKPNVFLSDEEVDEAFQSAIADYEAAARYARSEEDRLHAELDLAFISGNWRGLSARLERLLREPGCGGGNWGDTVGNIFGYSADLLERSYETLACDPRWTISWYNSARSALMAGNNVEALRLAREGSEIAPGTWLSGILIRTLLAHEQYDEARQELTDRVNEEFAAAELGYLIAASEGNRASVELLSQQLKTAIGPDRDFFIRLVYAAWGGDKQEANRLAALIDQHRFGAVTLVQIAQWCGCGMPWELDATPNFAAKLEESGLPWSPPTTMGLPLKDW